ncbi:hypothetical protein QBS70_15640 [Cronobacter sakazakii]|nr:hypothetical protein [Cronobacter sakazakii]
MKKIMPVLQAAVLKGKKKSPFAQIARFFNSHAPQWRTKIVRQGEPSGG